MKNVFFVLAFMLIGPFAFANQFETYYESINTEKIEIKIDKSNSDQLIITNISFYSSSDFDAFDLNQLNINDNCTVSVSVTVSVGFVSVTLTAENIPCDQVAAAVKRLVADARSAVFASE